MPFRSKTNQTPSIAVQSPYPRSAPLNPRSGSDDLPSMILKSSCYIANAKETLVKYSLLNQAMKSFQQIGGLLGMSSAFERHEEQIRGEIQHLTIHASPIFDRVGRMMTDLGETLARNADSAVNLIKSEERF